MEVDPELLLKMPNVKWEGSDETCENEEERRVLFAALDSFL